MNVLVITNMYPTEDKPFYGIFVKEQIEALRKEGIVIDVIFIDGKENRWNYFTSLVTVFKKLKTTHYDIIHAHHTYCVFPIMIVKKFLRNKAPLVLTFHEGEVHLPSELKPKNFDFFENLVLSKSVKQWALNMVDLLIPVQQELTNGLNYKGNCYVVPCGVDTDLFQPMDKTQCRKKLDLPLDKKIVFFPGDPQKKQKGLDILEESLANLSRNDIHLLTGGSIHHHDMPYYMCAADVVVQLSIFEASPMVLKEALAVNSIVLFTDAGDAKAIAGNTKGCFLCERSAEDVALKLNSALNYNGNSDGRSRILDGELTLQAVAKKNIQVYDEILTKEQSKVS